MKTINVGIVLDQVKAKCDFCGEGGKKCFRSPIIRSHLKIKYKTEWQGFLDHKEIITDRDYFHREEEPRIDICEDCVRQLSAFLK